MKRGTLLIDLGWFGFGIYRGLFPGVCLGPVKVMWVRGGIEAKFNELLAALERAKAAVRAVVT